MASPSNLRSLVSLYYASDEWRKLSENSRISYEQMLNSALRYGNHSLSNPINCYHMWAVAHGEAKALQICKVMRKLWNWGIANNKAQGPNPWANMNLKALNPRSAVWTKEQYDAAIDWCDRCDGELGKLLKLLYETGQRVGDILALRNMDINGYTITIRQQKTGKTVVLPVSSIIRSVGLPNIPNEYSFSNDFVRRYTHRFRIMRAAIPSLKGLQLRDLRRTVMTEMANGGATDAQIRAVSGHSPTSKIPEQVYIQRTAQQAADGLAKRTAIRNETLDEAAEAIKKLKAMG